MSVTRGSERVDKMSDSLFLRGGRGKKRRRIRRRIKCVRERERE